MGDSPETRAVRLFQVVDDAYHRLFPTASSDESGNCIDVPVDACYVEESGIKIELFRLSNLMMGNLSHNNRTRLIRGQALPRLLNVCQGICLALRTDSKCFRPTLSTETHVRCWELGQDILFYVWSVVCMPLACKRSVLFRLIRISPLCYPTERDASLLTAALLRTELIMSDGARNDDVVARLRIARAKSRDERATRWQIAQTILDDIVICNRLPTAIPVTFGTAYVRSLTTSSDVDPFYTEYDLACGLSLVIHHSTDPACLSAAIDVLATSPTVQCPLEMVVLRAVIRLSILLQEKAGFIWSEFHDQILRGLEWWALVRDPGPLSRDESNGCRAALMALMRVDKNMAHVANRLRRSPHNTLQNELCDLISELIYEALEPDVESEVACGFVKVLFSMLAQTTQHKVVDTLRFMDIAEADLRDLEQVPATTLATTTPSDEFRRRLARLLPRQWPFRTPPILRFSECTRGTNDLRTTEREAEQNAQRLLQELESEEEARRERKKAKATRQKLKRAKKKSKASEEVADATKEEEESPTEAESPTRLLHVSPDLLLCSATRLPLRDPVLLGDGRVYEKDVATSWIAAYGKVSPITGRPMRHERILANDLLVAILREEEGQEGQEG